jgi:hypothetical protein
LPKKHFLAVKNAHLVSLCNFRQRGGRFFRTIQSLAVLNPLWQKSEAVNNGL